MAKDVAPVDAPQTVGLLSDDFEWETVHTESPDQVTLDTIGDTFIAEYLGYEVIHFEDRDGDPQSFTQLKFRVGDQHYVMNAGYDLLQAFVVGPDAIPPKTVTRVQLRTLVDVGQQSPMKSHRIDAARPREDNSGTK